jgi:hypothetical protein
MELAGPERKHEYPPEAVTLRIVSERRGIGKQRSDEYPAQRGKRHLASRVACLIPVEPTQGIIEKTDLFSRDRPFAAGLDAAEINRPKNHDDDELSEREMMLR